MTGYDRVPPDADIKDLCELQKVERNYGVRMC